MAFYVGKVHLGIYRHAWLWFPLQSFLLSEFFKCRGSFAFTQVRKRAVMADFIAGFNPNQFPAVGQNKIYFGRRSNTPQHHAFKIAASFLLLLKLSQSFA